MCLDGGQGRGGQWRDGGETQDVSSHGLGITKFLGFLEMQGERFQTGRVRVLVSYIQVVCFWQQAESHIVLSMHTLFSSRLHALLAVEGDRS